jgi:hypothetical protein
MPRPLLTTRVAFRRLGLVTPLAVLGGVLLGVMGNGVYESAKAGFQAAGLSPDAAAPVTVLAALGLTILLILVVRRYVVAVGLSPNSGQRVAPKKRGLILLVSNAEHALYAVKHHFINGPLEQVWLIASNAAAAAEFGHGTLSLAEEIRKQALALAGEHGRTLEVTVRPEAGVSAADAHDTFDAVRRIYRQSRLPAEDVIADFTGGTKPMTVGLILASLAPERSLEYVSLHRPTGNMHGPFLIDYRAELFDLPGD